MVRVHVPHPIPSMGNFSNDKVKSLSAPVKRGLDWFFFSNFITLGVSIDEVRILKDLQAQSNDCHQAKEIVDKNLVLIDQKINDLKNLKKQLKVLSESCHETSAAKDCEIVKTLTKASEGEDCVCHTKTTKNKQFQKMPSLP